MYQLSTIANSSDFKESYKVADAHQETVRALGESELEPFCWNLDTHSAHPSPHPTGTPTSHAAWRPHRGPYVYRGASSNVRFEVDRSYLLTHTYSKPRRASRNNLDGHKLRSLDTLDRTGGYGAETKSEF